jgi:uncharacterized protein YjbI with pentapeptide repeats
MAENYQDKAESKKEQRREVTFKWLNLLGVFAIPFVVTVMGIYLSQQIGQQQSQVSEQQHQADLQIAATRYANDQQLAKDQQQEATLQTYLGDMSGLLLNNKLLKSSPGDVLRQVARARTLTTLRKLDAGRNKIVLQFLQDARLIGIRDAIIDLSNADLSGADLSGADLSGIDLSGAKLSGAILNDTMLDHTVLNHADLSNATLKGAILSDTFLNSAILTDADLSDADMGGADLSEANLSNATLKSTNLNGAIMNGTILIGANLSNANLAGVGNFTQTQLDEVYSCTNAILSTELKCNRNR